MRNVPYCPKCGKEVSEDDVFCPHCGERLKAAEERAAPVVGGPQPGAFEHLTLAFNLAQKKPMVFVPALLGSLISIIISNIVTFGLGLYSWQYWSSWFELSPNLPGLMSVMLLVGLFSLIGAIISYILFFASLDMSRDAYVDVPLSLGESVSYTLNRIGVFVVASIVGVILSMTIILIPAVILMFVIMVVDEAGIGNSLSKAFRVFGRELGNVLILLVIAIVGSVILGFVPFIGSLLTAALNVVIGIAFIDLYSKFKKMAPVS